jgi:hypothetical protein
VHFGSVVGGGGAGVVAGGGAAVVGDDVGPGVGAADGAGGAVIGCAGADGLATGAGDAGLDPAFGAGSAAFGEGVEPAPAGLPTVNDVPAVPVAVGAEELTEPAARAGEPPDGATTCVPMGRPFSST